MAVIAHSVHAPFRRAEMRGTVAPVAGLARRSGGADDSALAQRAAAGDGDAFAELYERHESRAFNLCYRILGSRDDAADATQEAFVGVLRRLPQLADRDLAFGSYVLTSARNACYDLIERRKRTQPSDEIPESATPMGGGGGRRRDRVRPRRPRGRPRAQRAARGPHRGDPGRQPRAARAPARGARPARARGALVRRDRRADGHEPELGRPAHLARPDQPARRAARHRARLDRRELARLRAGAAADRAASRTASSTRTRTTPAGSKST